MTALPLRVLWVTETHPPSRGGMATSSDRITAGLRGLGVVVDIAHLTARDVPWSVTGGSRGRLFTAPIADDPEDGMRRLFAAITAASGASSADAPHTHVVAFGGAFPLVSAPVYAAWLGAPLVTLLRGNDWETGVFSLRRRAALDDAIRRSARVCVVAADAAARVRALHPAAVVEHVPNGLDLDGWEATDADRARAGAWRAAAVPEGRTVIGVVGQLKRKKGVVDLLDALATAGAAASVHVALVGDVEPAVADWLADRAAGADLSWSAEPFLDRWELLARYPAFDWVAIPSVHDGMPNVALEAAALGIPLLASDAGGLADIVEDGVSGIRFRAADRADLTDAVVRAMAVDASEHCRLGAGAAKTAVAFDQSVEAARYLTILEETRA